MTGDNRKHQPRQGGKARVLGGDARARRNSAAPPERQFSEQFRADQNGQMRVYSLSGVSQVSAEASLEEVIIHLNKIIGKLQRGV